MIPYVKNLVSFLIVEGFLLLLCIVFMFTYCGPVLGYPFAAYWSLLFYLSSALLLYLLRDFFSRDYRPINFLSRKYYSSQSVFLGIFMLAPFIFLLLFVLFQHKPMPEDKLLNESDIAFIGQVEKDSAAYDRIRFNIIDVLKGEEKALMIARVGLIEPKGCFFSINSGDVFKIYLKRDISTAYVLTCSNMIKKDAGK